MSEKIIEVNKLGKRFKIGAIVEESRGDQVGYRSLFSRGINQVRRFFGRTRKTRDFWALKDLDFHVNQGEVLGVIGRNGAGKSTLLKILSRITPPTEGQIRIKGRLASLLEVGTGFHDELTGRENVFMNGRILGMSRSEVAKSFDDIVEFAGVAQFIDTPMKRYSSGMKVRLGFAVAAHLNAEILLVDEVLSVGDAEFQRKSIKRLGEITRSGRTIFLVSHNLSTMLELSTRAIVMEHGQKVFDGVPADAVDLYLQSCFKKGEDDLSNWDRPNWIAEPPVVRFNSIRLVELDRDLRAEDPIELIIGMQVIRDMQDVDVRVAIGDSDGRRLIFCRSADSGFRINGKAGEQIHLRFRIDRSYLSAGKYSVSLTAVEGTKVYLDHVEQGLQFQVMPGRNDSFSVFHAQHVTLGLRLESRFEFCSESLSTEGRGTKE